MAEEAPSDTPASHVPDTVSRWLSEIADEKDVTEEELLNRFLNPESDGKQATINQESIEALNDELDSLRSEFQSKIQDVRDRVIQVKRETDNKAQADHSHPQVNRALTELKQDLDELDDQLRVLEVQLQDGFENYEEILEYLTDSTDELNEKLTTLAAAVINFREKSESLSRRQSQQMALTRILNTANTQNVKRAECEACDEKIDLGLLAFPACPHCNESFGNLEVNRGFFNTSKLITGSVPAIEGETSEESVDLSDLAGDEVEIDHPAIGGEKSSSTEESDDSDGTESSSFQNEWVTADASEGSETDQESTPSDPNTASPSSGIDSPVDGFEPAVSSDGGDNADDESEESDEDPDADEFRSLFE